MRSTLLTSQHRFSDSIYRLPDRGYSRVGLDDYYQLCGAGASGSFHNASGYPVIDLSLFPDMKSAPCSLTFHPRNLCPHRVCVWLRGIWVCCLRGCHVKRGMGSVVWRQCILTLLQK